MLGETFYILTAVCCLTLPPSPFTFPTTPHLFPQPSLLPSQGGSWPCETLGVWVVRRSWCRTTSQTSPIRLFASACLPPLYLPPSFAFSLAWHGSGWTDRQTVLARQGHVPTTTHTLGMRQARQGQDMADKDRDRGGQDSVPSPPCLCCAMVACPYLPGTVYFGFLGTLKRTLGGGTGWRGQGDRDRPSPAFCLAVSV